MGSETRLDYEVNPPGNSVGAGLGSPIMLLLAFGFLFGFRRPLPVARSFFFQDPGKDTFDGFIEIPPHFSFFCLRRFPHASHKQVVLTTARGAYSDQDQGYVRYRGGAFLGPRIRKMVEEEDESLDALEFELNQMGLSVEDLQPPEDGHFDRRAMARVESARIMSRRFIERDRVKDRISTQTKVRPYKQRTNGMYV